MNRYKKFRPRAVVYCKDIAHITGRKRSAAQRLMMRIRKRLKKEPEQFITIKDFCNYTGIDEEVVKGFIEDS